VLINRVLEATSRSACAAALVRELAAASNSTSADAADAKYRTYVMKYLLKASALLDEVRLLFLLNHQRRLPNLLRIYCHYAYITRAEGGARPAAGSRARVPGTALICGRGSRRHGRQRRQDRPAAPGEALRPATRAARRAARPAGAAAEAGALRRPA